jgi:arginase
MSLTATAIQLSPTKSMFNPSDEGMEVERSLLKAHMNIVYIPSDIGSLYHGKSLAPAAFQEVGLSSALKTTGYRITETTAFERGDATWEHGTRNPNGARNEAKTVNACVRVRDTISRALDADASAFQLVIGGECLFCPPILSAYWHHLPAEKTIGMIYIDADCDLFTPKDGSGNIAGMTLTHLTLREGALDSMNQFGKKDGSGVVDGNNIVLFGTNIESSSNRRKDLAYLFDNNYRVFTSSTVQSNPTKYAKQALKWLEKRVDYILVHLDVDVIDPGDFPLSNVPNWTGLGFDQTMDAVAVFLASSKVAGMSIAEVNPNHDPGLSMTGRLVGKLVDGFKERIKASRLH